MVSLYVIQGPDKGRTFDLPDRENVIGRQSATAELTDRTVSRQHASLAPHDGAWLLSDLGSANGTYLNGVKLTRPAPVQHGDQIRCGASLLVFGGGLPTGRAAPIQLDSGGQIIDAAIVATVPSNEDSVIIPTPEAGVQAIDNLRILYDLIGEVGSIFNVDVLVHRVLEKVFEVLRPDRGYVMLIDEKGNLDLRASRVAETGRDKEVPVSRTIIHEVVSQQVGVLSSNAMSDKRFTSGKSVHDLGIRSAICVPIKGRGRILGVIHVDCGVAERSYSTEDLRLLTAVGYQTGQAIENARLHESAVQAERWAAVGETAAYLSHHIKNILQALVAGADVIKMGLDSGNLGKARGAWPVVDRNLRKINDTIMNMLAFSKERRPLLETVNVNHVLEECISLISGPADERGVAVLSDLDDLPAIPADTAGLHQAFVNLMTNALEAVRDQTGAITIRSEYEALNRAVVVRVTDNGAGIPPDQMRRIFDPFWSSKGQKGTGLGLAVARKVVEEHHGRIDVTSKVGEETTFTVVLPAVGPADAGDTHPGK